METALVNGRVLQGDELCEGRSVLIRDGRIAAVCPDAELAGGAARVDLQRGMLLPGFIDVQVNGGGGVLFNESPTPEAIDVIGRAHRRFGTTRFLPTLISDGPGTIVRAIDAVDRCRNPGAIGIHVEGPFLNEARKGVHDASKFRMLDEEAAVLLSAPRRNLTLLTLAPEETTPEMIRRLSEAGVIVCAGHTNATYEEVRAALEAGLKGFTHLYNAMSPLLSRAPGVVGAALEDRESWCGMIVDGHHVHPAALKIALRCKPRGKAILVTDAMPSVGSDARSFMLQGRLIRVENGACRSADGTLAGSDLDMASAVRNAVRLLELDLGEAVRMASQYPAEFLGVGDRLGRIAPGYCADLVLCDDELKVLETWVNGEPSGTDQARSGAPDRGPARAQQSLGA